MCQQRFFNTTSLWTKIPLNAVSAIPVSLRHFSKSLIILKDLGQNLYLLQESLPSSRNLAVSQILCTAVRFFWSAVFLQMLIKFWNLWWNMISAFLISLSEFRFITSALFLQLEVQKSYFFCSYWQCISFKPFEHKRLYFTLFNNRKDQL